MDDVASAPRRVPRPPGKLWLGLGVSLAIVAAVLAFINQRVAPSPSGGYLIATVHLGDLSSGVTATGSIAAATAVPLNFKLSGRVAEIDVKIGDRIQPGQVLARLDPGDLQAQLRQSQANLAAAQANEAELRQEPQRVDIAAAQAVVDAARTQLATARQNLTAAQSATARGVAVARQAVATAQQTGSDAGSNLAAVQAQSDASAADDHVAVTNAQQTLADAELQTSNAQKTFAALPAVVEEQIASARNNLWAQQINRDAACGHGKGGVCDGANAQVAAAQSALDQANALAIQQTRQGQTLVDQSQAQANQAQATLKSATAAASSDVAKLEGSLVAARAQAHQAGESLDMAEATLASAEAQAAQTVQAAQSQVDLAEAAWQSAKATYDQKTAPPSQAELDNAVAQVASQQALVDLAQANLDSATLIAPSAGVVTALNGAVGQWLIGGSTSGAAANAASGANNSTSNYASNFISLTDLSQLQVDAQVNEADVSRVTADHPVKFTVDAFPGRTFDGKVAVVQPLGTSSNNVVTYTVTIDINPTSVQLLPGMTANITILTTDVPNTLIIPSTAISFAQSQGASSASGTTAQPKPAANFPPPQSSTGSQPSASAAPAASPAARAPGPATVIVVASGKGTPRQIQTGVSDDRNTQVLSGLNPGEELAVGTAQS